jgi:hypothetical protein
MTFRLLACDIDNTLVRFPEPPSPRIVQAVRRASKAGATVVLVTGRAFRRARPIARALGLAAPIVCNHGGSIRDPRDGRTLYRSTLPQTLTHEIVCWLKTQDVCVLLFEGDRVFRDCPPEHIVPDFQVYARGEHAVLVEDVREHIPQETEIVLSTGYDHDHLGTVYEQAINRWDSRVRVLFSHPYGVDIMPPSSKSQALAWLAAHLGIPQAQVLAIGDGKNDVDMLAWAGMGIAIGDGDREAQAVAQVIAPPFDRDGAAWAIEQYVL